MDHPFETVGIFVDNTTGLPSNGFFLIPGQDRTGMSLITNFQRRRRLIAPIHQVRSILNEALSKVTDPDPADFVARSVWNNTHV